MKSSKLVLFLLFAIAVSRVSSAPKPQEEEAAAPVDSSEEEFSSGNDEHDRKMIVGELIKMETKLDADIERNDHYDIRYALVNLETKILPRVARLSRNIEGALTNVDQKAGEHKFQRGLVEDIARIMYKAGARACLSPDETFYVPENKCLPYGANVVYNPCNKTDQILYDGKNNEGACDCVDDERQLIYFQGECHIQNVQGPCVNGSWLILVNGVPECQPVPVNCTADGQHIHWSPDPKKVQPECHVIGQRGPCSIGQITTRATTGVIKCVFPPEPNAEPKKEPAAPSVWDRPPCAVGSFRKQNSRCAV